MIFLAAGGHGERRWPVERGDRGRGKGRRALSRAGGVDAARSGQSKELPGA